MANPFATGGTRAPNPFSKPRSGGNPLAGGGYLKAPPIGTPTHGGGGGHHSLLGGILHGVTGGVEHFAGDVAGAVTGLPEGIIHGVEHPIGAAKGIAHAEWQTWSPLFHGHVGAFAHGVYEHPLAPLLDVATVFSLGLDALSLGAATPVTAGLIGARGVEAADAVSQAGRLSKLADLRTATPRRILTDPTDAGRPAYDQLYSPHAARHAFQATMDKVGEHLPNWYGTKDKLASFRYEKTHIQDVTHRVVAKNLMVNAAMKAGKALADPVTGPALRQGLVGRMYLQLWRHGKVWDPAKAIPEGYVAVQDTGVMRADELSRLDRRSTHWHNVWANHAQAAQLRPVLDKHIGELNDALAKHYAQGSHVVEPAATKGVKGAMEQEAKPVVDLASQLEKTIRLRDKAVHSEGVVKRASDRIDAINQRRGELHQASFRDAFAGARTEAGFQEMAANLSKYTTTRSVGKALTDEHGMIRIVPKHIPKNLGLEAAHSNVFVRWLYQKPTQVWKSLLLGYSPRLITNNAVGNWFMYAMRQGGDHGLAGVYDAIRMTHGEKGATRLLAGQAGKQAWLYRHFGDELGNVFGRTFDMGGRQASRKAQGLYPVVHRVADEPVRRAAISAFLRGAPAVKALMKDGKSFDQAATIALKRDTSLRDAAAAHARTVAGDYTSMTGVGRAARNVMPFYLWDRHILKTTGNIFADSPERLMLMQRVSGQGNDAVTAALGSIPSFLRNVVPIFAHGKDGRASVLSTQSLNPFATVADITDMAKGLTTGGGLSQGSDAASGLNPILSGLIEQMSGKSLLTGGPVQTHGGVVPSILGNMLEGLPQVRLEQALRGGIQDTAPNGKPLLYEKSPMAAVTSILGVPIKRVDLSKAAQMAAKEQQTLTGKKSGKKHRVY